jgi:hypothetical protein
VEPTAAIFDAHHHCNDDGSFFIHDEKQARINKKSYAKDMKTGEYSNTSVKKTQPTITVMPLKLQARTEYNQTLLKTKVSYYSKHTANHVFQRLNKSNETSIAKATQTTTARAPKRAANPPTVPTCTLPAALLGAFAEELVVELGEELLERDEVDEELDELLLDEVLVVVDEAGVEVEDVAAEVLVVPAVADEARPPATAKKGE